jgi:hypothetical protein
MPNAIELQRERVMRYWRLSRSNDDNVHDRWKAKYDRAADRLKELTDLQHYACRTEGDRKGWGEAAVSVGGLSPDKNAEVLGLTMMLAIAAEIPNPGAGGKQFIANITVNSVRNLMAEGQLDPTAGGFAAAAEIPKIWGAISGGSAQLSTVWVRSTCYECRCQEMETWELTTVLTWQEDETYESRWVKCKTSQTAWGKTKANNAKEQGDVIAGALLTVDDLRELEDQCIEQVTKAECNATQ